MSDIHTEIVTGPSAWIGADLRNEPDWIYTFTPDELDELDAALQQVKTRGLAFNEIDREVFPLPTLSAKLSAFLDEIRLGRGFVVLRGLPVQAYSDEDVGRLFWGMGRYLGEPVAQNPQGDVLGHVFDHGRTYGEIDVRGYQSNAHLPFHSDGSDMVGLLCLRQAKSGGASSIVSSVTLHNEILKRRPSLLPALYRGYYYIRREAALTDRPISSNRIPVFGAQEGYVSCRIVPTQIEAACEKTGTPLGADEREALDFFVELAKDPELHLDMYLQPGDIQLCNNYTILHSRTDFEDWPESERQRHMVRLWLTFAERRPLSPEFPPQNGYEPDNLVELALASDTDG